MTTTTETMFEIAARKKFRYTTTKCLMSTEDLWDLPLTARGSGVSLDVIAVSLNEELKASGEVSFVKRRTATDKTLELKFEIVKRIIEVKQNEAEAAVETKAAAEKRQRILEVIAKKKDSQLEEMSLEELEKLV